MLVTQVGKVSESRHPWRFRMGVGGGVVGTGGSPGRDCAPAELLLDGFRDETPMVMP